MPGDRVYMPDRKTSPERTQRLLPFTLMCGALTIPIGGLKSRAEKVNRSILARPLHMNRLKSKSQRARVIDSRRGCRELETYPSIQSSRPSNDQVPTRSFCIAPASETKELCIYGNRAKKPKVAQLLGRLINCLKWRMTCRSFLAPSSSGLLAFPCHILAFTPENVP
jgi:hypothetical protein